MEKHYDIILNTALSSRCLKWIKISLEAYSVLQSQCQQGSWCGWNTLAALAAGGWTYPGLCWSLHISDSRALYKTNRFPYQSVTPMRATRLSIECPEHSGVQKWFFCIGRKCQANLIEDCWLQRYFPSCSLWKLAAEQGKDWRKDISRRLSFHRHQRILTWARGNQRKAWLALLPTFICKLTNFLSSSEYYRIPSCKNAYGMEPYWAKHFHCLCP